MHSSKNDAILIVIGCMLNKIKATQRGMKIILLGSINTIDLNDTTIV